MSRGYFITEIDEICNIVPEGYEETSEGLAKLDQDIFNSVETVNSILSLQTRLEALVNEMEAIYKILSLLKYRVRTKSVYTKL